MSGHSKWAQIKRQKGVSDVKRGQVFTKLANAITIAVRQGGGTVDPNQNFKLRLTIEKARLANMPKENIERAIEKGAGKGGHEEGLEEVVYEGFGPRGVAVLVEAVTDNKKRTTPEIKNIFEKNGGSLAKSGAVSYQFQKKGLITAIKNGKTADDIFLIAADAGADDIEDIGEDVLIYTEPEKLSVVRNRCVSLGLSITDAELIRKPTVTAEVTNEQDAQKILSFIEKLESLDEVQKVYANFDIPDQFL